MLPAAAVILAVALVLAGTVVPWLTGLLARRRESRFAAVRGDLGAAMVDLTEGAPSSSPSAPWTPSSATIREQDAELTAIAVGIGGHGRRRAGPHHPAGRAGLLGLSPGRHPGGGRPAGSSGTELAVITLIPLAAFELVVGLPVATQALQRVRQAAARVFEVTDAPDPVPDPEVAGAGPRRPLRPGGPVGVGRLPGRRRPGAPGGGPLAPPGRRVAVVGPSGAGKSTLAAVLLRFLPCAGRFGRA